jgi:hypothetical protein
MIITVACIDAYTTAYLADRQTIHAIAKEEGGNNSESLETETFNGMVELHIPRGFFLAEINLVSGGFITAGDIVHGGSPGKHFEYHPIADCSQKAYFPLTNPDGRKIDTVLLELREDYPPPAYKDYSHCAKCHNSKPGTQIYMCRRCAHHYCDNCKYVKKDKFRRKLFEYHACWNCGYMYPENNCYEDIRNYVVARL